MILGLTQLNDVASAEHLQHHSTFLIFHLECVSRRSYIAVATKVRTLGSKGVWGLCPQLGVPPLHPVLTNPSMAINEMVGISAGSLDYLVRSHGSR